MSLRSVNEKPNAHKPGSETAPEVQEHSMWWTFEIPTGRYFDPSGAYISTGYAGFGAGKDNVADESIADIGPLPENLYAFGDWYTDPEKGPLVTHLTPVGDGEMYGRSGMMVHGDSIEHPGQASLGCCVADHPTRLAMSTSPCQFIRAVKQFTPAAVG